MKVIFDWFDAIRGRKEIIVGNLPSRGIFYDNDFKIYIKKVEIEDILEYEKLYKNDLSVALSLIKNIVKKHTILPKKYAFFDIKSIDIVYIFLEIVSLSTNKKIKISFYDDLTGEEELVDFDEQSFNYFEIPEQLQKTFDNNTKEFVIDGFKFSIPSIGVETSLGKFLLDKAYSPDADKYNGYEYNFMYFIGNKKILTFSEIESFIEVFNLDIGDEQKEKINKIVDQFNGFSKYTIKSNDKVVELSSKIDLSRIWK